MPGEDKKGNSLPNNVELAAKVFSIYGNFIRSTIKFNIRDEALCDDLFQDLFLHLVSKPIPDDVRNIKGFLFKVITDKIKDSVRSIGRYQRRVRRSATEQRGTFNRRPEQELIEVEEITRMFESIRKRLSPTENSAVSLRYKNGYTIKEIAEKMGVKSRSASRYLSVGLRKARDHFHLEGRD